LIFIDILREKVSCIFELGGFYWLVISSRKQNQPDDDSAYVRPKVLQTRIHIRDGGSHVTILAV